MYTIVANQFEFDPPDSEQDLTIVVGCAPEFKTIASFLAACEESTRADESGIESTLCAQLTRKEIIDTLDRFIPRVTVPRAAQVYTFNDEWDDRELLICWPGRYIWYHWYTTA